MLQEGLEDAGDLVEEDLEDEMNWPGGAQVKPVVVVHPKALERTIRQFVRMDLPAIHQDLVAWC